MMDNMIYKERRLSKTEEMFHAVFSSKAVLAAVILSGIVCISNIAFAVICRWLTKDLTFEDLGKYIMLIPDTENPYETFQNIYAAITGLVYVFIVWAVVYFWIALGMFFIYIRTKNPDSQKSVHTGFTIIQAFGITKLIAGGLQTLLVLFAGLALLQSIETFIAGIVTLIITAVDFMYTISIIVFCSSVKKTADGMVSSSAGAGMLQFSSFITGIVQGIIAVFLMITMLAPLRTEESISAESIALIEDMKLYGIVLTAAWMAAIVIHFLVFAVARHYARKLPLAANADRVYQNNMANLYPQQMYNPNQNYQPYNFNQDYVPFQPPENNNVRVPYNATNDSDDHSLIDNTQYPPYEKGNH